MGNIRLLTFQADIGLNQVTGNTIQIHMRRIQVMVMQRAPEQGNDAETNRQQQGRHFK